MSLPYFIAKRHLFGRHKVGYISFISIISVVGLAVGVAALILTISILNGFEKEVKSKLLNFDAHIRLRLMYNDNMDSTNVVTNVLDSLPEIEHYEPYIHRSVIIRKGKETDGVILEGISEEGIKTTLKIEEFIREGEINFFPEEGLDGLVIGGKLAEYLDVDVGDKVYLFLLHGVRGIGNRPRVAAFQITGIYDSGISDYDDIFIYSSLDAAQRLFNMGDNFSGFQMILNEPEAAEQVSDQINDILGFPYHALSWNDLHMNLFEWLRVQRFPILLVFGLIAVVAIFNVTSAIMMIIIEKTKDIGILMSMGVNRRQVSRLFFLESLFIGIAGTIAGYILALILTWLQIRFHIIAIPQDVYFMSDLPVLLNWKDFAYIGAGALFFCIVATIYPSIKAFSLSPSEATRYE